mmetsp:Transcript_24940/g.78600  ORF Transcript_24940/g.78600 Transcript_24940/m.78600 type:complete len:264 (-) Transcript_24940:282-1073(-)
MSCTAGARLQHPCRGFTKTANRFVDLPEDTAPAGQSFCKRGQIASRSAIKTRSGKHVVKSDSNAGCRAGLRLQGPAGAPLWSTSGWSASATNRSSSAAPLSGAPASTVCRRCTAPVRGPSGSGATAALRSWPAAPGLSAGMLQPQAPAGQHGNGGPCWPGQRPPPQERAGGRGRPLQAPRTPSLRRRLRGLASRRPLPLPQSVSRATRSRPRGHRRAAHMEASLGTPGLRTQHLHRRPARHAALRPRQAPATRPAAAWAALAA